VIAYFIYQKKTKTNESFTIKQSKLPIESKKKLEKYKNKAINGKLLETLDLMQKSLMSLQGTSYNFKNIKKIRENIKIVELASKGDDFVLYQMKDGTMDEANGLLQALWKKLSKIKTNDDSGKGGDSS